jgi:hypothetical protein
MHFNTKILVSPEAIMLSQVRKRTKAINMDLKQQYYLARRVKNKRTLKQIRMTVTM